MDENPYEAPQIESEGKPIDWLDVLAYSSMAVVLVGYCLMASVGVVRGLSFDDAMKEWPIGSIGAGALFSGWAGICVSIAFGSIKKK